jgi:N-acetylglucosamine-6-phosphate deacetylase
MTLVIKNCRLYTDEAGDKLSSIVIEDGKIRSVLQSIDGVPDTVEVIDAGARCVIPGLIEVHLQGAGGADVLDGTEESLSAIAKALARTGVTSYLGTTVVKPMDGNRHLLVAREAVMKDLGGASLLGIHLEGPFINKDKKGGLDPASIYPSSEQALEEIMQVTAGTLRMMTIAPELPGNLDAIRELTRRGVVAAFAHSDATYEQTHQGFEAGIRHVTHIFNAMAPLHHRKPGPLAAIFERPDTTAQIISDGHHLHPAIVRLIHAQLGDDRCVCITDGMPGIGLPEGTYIYNGKQYTSKDGAARYLDGTLIGSTMSLLHIAYKYQSFTGSSFRAAIDSVTKNPAAVLGLSERKGAIRPGFDADLVVLDTDNEVWRTLVQGREVYARAPEA